MFRSSLVILFNPFLLLIEKYRVEGIFFLVMAFLLAEKYKEKKSLLAWEVMLYFL